MRIAAGILALACLSGEETAPPRPAGPIGSVLALLNAERARAGAPALVADPILGRVAQARAEEIAAGRNLEALDGSGNTIGERAAKAGYEVREVQEILLIGGDSFEARLRRLRETDPEAFADAMRPEYRGLGAGIAESEEGIVRALVFGRSAKDDFEEKTAPLEDREAVRARILSRVNEERRARRLPPYVESARLDQAAQNHAEDMIRRSYYSHQSPEGSTVMERAQGVGYTANTIGENIAEGQGSAAEVMDSWMGSPRHRDHILALTFREIGIGLAFGKNERGWEIVWVQVFGLPRGDSGPPRRSPR